MLYFLRLPAEINKIIDEYVNGGKQIKCSSCSKKPYDNKLYNSYNEYLRRTGTMFCCSNCNGNFYRKNECSIHQVDVSNDYKNNIKYLHIDYNILCDQCATIIRGKVQRKTHINILYQHVKTIDKNISKHMEVLNDSLYKLNRSIVYLNKRILTLEAKFDNK